MSAKLFFLILLAVMANACLAGGGPAATQSMRPIPRVTIVAPRGSPLLSATGPSPEALPTSSPSQTVGPTPRAAVGTPSARCVNGWTRPAVASPEHDEALAILDAAMGVTGSWAVAEMRYFTGPEVPWIIDGVPVVQRWYVHAGLVADPAFRARWLIEKWTDETKGISAVAARDTAGYHSPDWTGFAGDGPPTTYLGLPGRWSGTPYDFVTGEGDSGNPGLPEEVMGCLAGT